MERFLDEEVRLSHPDLSKQYVLVKRDLIWPDAAAYAEFFGMRLAEIPDHPTNVVLAELMKDHGVSEAWIGATDKGMEGNWHWYPTFRPIQYSNWAPGEPNNSTKFTPAGENYAAISSNGLWNDLWSEERGHHTRAFLMMPK